MAYQMAEIGRVELGSGVSMRVKMDDHEQVAVTWPTTLNPAEAISAVSDTLAHHEVTRSWLQVVVLPTTKEQLPMTIEDYLDDENVRKGIFNTRVVGLRATPSGRATQLGVLHYASDLMGTFDLRHADVANDIIEATIIEAGKGRAYGIAALATRYAGLRA